MKTLMAEYGTFIVSCVVLAGTFAIIVALPRKFRSFSKDYIALITGVDNTDYTDRDGNIVGKDDAK